MKSEFTKPSRRGAAGKRFVCSIEGGYRLALKRNLGHSALTALLQSLEAPISRQALARWEHVLAANVVGQSRRFFEDNGEAVRDLMRSSPPMGPSTSARAFSFENNAVRGNATNSSVKHSLKCHVCEVRSCFLLPDMTADGLVYDSSDDVCVHRVFPDLASPPNAGGAEQRLLYMKQVKHSGLPTWTDALPFEPFEPLEPLNGPDQHVARDVCVTHVRFWIMVSDQGPDQKAADALMNSDIEIVAHQMKFKESCVDRIAHPMVDLITHVALSKAQAVIRLTFMLCATF